MSATRKITRRLPQSKWWRIVLFPVGLYASWLAMLAMHEAGHVMHAMLSGGRVVQVRLPPLGFSQTIVHPNPHELLVAWGGPVWGVAIPLIPCGFLIALGRRVPKWLRFFAGFCLIANGAYVGVGWLARAGDAGEMLRLGTPVWAMGVFGAVCVAAGLWIWHRTPSLSLRVSGATPPPAPRGDASRQPGD